MLVGFPIMLGVGIPALAANITSNLVIFPGQLASAYGYRRYLKKLPRQYLLLLIPCVVGGITGALILRHTSSTEFQKLVPWLILFAVVLFTFQPVLHFHLQRHLSRRNKKLFPLVLISLGMLPTAIYGGYFGAGFGFIVLAFLGFTKLRDVHQMNALKNLASATISSVSLVCLFSTHLIQWQHGLFMAAGSITGGYYGSVFAQKIPSRTIRIVIIIIGFSAAAYLGLVHH